MVAILLVVPFPVSGAAEAHESIPTFVASFDGALIDTNVCRPASASAENPVPIVIQGHGWGGQKSGCGSFTQYLDAGMAVVSMTQRGNGASEGENNVMDPDFEGRDIMAVIDHVASLDWVLKDDGPGGVDPVLGGLGGSYGGGFQWIGAFTDQMLRGEPTRFNALAPGNTWYDLETSLAPNGVMRTAIVAGLWATGMQNQHLAPWISAALASGMATNRLDLLPGPLDYGAEIHQHSAAWFVEQGMTLDIPVRINQGSADVLFNFNEGWHNYERSLTPEARAKSLFITSQDGHGLPAAVPSGPLPYTPFGGEACAAPSQFEWLREQLLGIAAGVPEHALQLSTVGGECVALDALPPAAAQSVAALAGAAIPIGPRGELRLVPVLEGPARLAGIPTLSLTAATTDADARLFWGLAVGADADSAKLVGAQWMPTRMMGPTLGATVATELGGVVLDVPAGEMLYLAVAPAVDQFVGHASRSVGVVLVDDVTLGLPIA